MINKVSTLDRVGQLRRAARSDMEGLQKLVKLIDEVAPELPQLAANTSALLLELVDLNPNRCTVCGSRYLSDEDGHCFTCSMRDQVAALEQKMQELALEIRSKESDYYRCEAEANEIKMYLKEG